MKKYISLMLTVLMLLSCCVIANASENVLTVTVANDLHLNLKSATTPVKKNNTMSEAFYHAGHMGQMPEESLALLAAFLEKAAADESDFVLLPGDLADQGTQEEHQYFASMLAEFESTSGKQVYVVPGNHDVVRISLDEFSTYYAQFGYDEAIAKDTLSASYVVDLNGEYRLLAIDSTIPKAGKHGIDESRLAWIRTQCEQAKADGKKMIAMMHHNLLQHFVLGEILHGGAIVDGDVALAELLAVSGVKFIFTGHTHDHDIASYTAADGSMVYDIVTTALFAYPCAYRVVTFAENVTIETRNITSVDTALLPEGITDEALALAKTDMLAYAKECKWIGMRAMFDSYVSAKMLKSLLKLDPVADAQMCDILDKVGGKLNEAVNMPLYKTDGQMSIEEYLTAFDIAIPKTNYKDVIDLVTTLYEAHVAGDENYPGYSDEVVLMTRALAGVLHYALCDVTEDEYVAVLDYMTAFFGYELDEEILRSAGSAISRMSGIELIATTVLMPLICEFTVDDAPADCNVTLPGFDKTQEDTRSFFEQIIDFFKQLFDAFATFLAHFFG